MAARQSTKLTGIGLGVLAVGFFGFPFYWLTKKQSMPKHQVRPVSTGVRGASGEDALRELERQQAEAKRRIREAQLKTIRRQREAQARDE